MTETAEALTFAAAAPVIAILIGYIKGVWPRTKDFGAYLPIVSLALSFGWGATLWATGSWDGEVAAFVTTGILVSTSAAGIARTAGALPGRLPGTE